MKKKIIPVIITLLVLGLIAVGIYFFAFYKPVGTANGYWNEATQECWVSQDHPPGESFPSGDELMFVSCCFNQEGNQVDCNDPENIIGGGLSQAIYGAGGAAGLPGIFSVSHVITLTNDGSVPIDNIWVDSATWTPTHVELTNAYNQIIGSGTIYAGALPVGNSLPFSTDVIDLTAIAGPPGSPNTYDLDLTAKATAYAGQLTSSQDVSGQIIVEQEAIGFSITIEWGA